MLENTTYTDKTSLLIENQFPAYIRDNPKYANFIAFVKTYYEWAEEHGDFTDGENSKFNFVNVSKNLLNYQDIDRTEDAYIDYFMQDFMPDFPTDCLADKRKLIKIARSLYLNRGIQDSYKFVFRALYDENVELYNHYNLVFKPSNNRWIQNRRILINSTDDRWYETKGKILFGSVSGGYAVITSVVKYVSDDLNEQNLLSIYIEKVNRKFQNGETVYTVDDMFRKIGDLEGIIVSSLFNLTIEDGGTSYKVGDPIIASGGLNQNLFNTRPAKLEVSRVSQSSIESVRIISVGDGYVPDAGELKSIDTDHDDGLRYYFQTTVGLEDVGDGEGANLSVVSYNNVKYPHWNTATDQFVGEGGLILENPRKVNNIFIDTLEEYINWPLAGIDFIALFNGSTSLKEDVIVELLHRASFNTYGITNIEVFEQGSKYSSNTKVVPSTQVTVHNTTNDTNTVFNTGDLGILGSISILNGGSGYREGDIFYVAGDGEGAYFKVTSLDNPTNGVITSVEWINIPDVYYPIGGSGYSESGLSDLSFEPYGTSDSDGNINATGQVNGSGAYFSITSILGKSCAVKPISTSYGQILQVDVLDQGFGYSDIPEIYTDVQDIVYSGDFEGCSRGFTVYQGTDAELTFVATFDSFVELDNGINLLRCYGCTGAVKANERIMWKWDIQQMPDDQVAYVVNYTNPDLFFDGGVRIYGNGQAVITAKISDGVSKQYGYFKNNNSLPSNTAQRIQSTIFNDYTYRLISSAQYENYEDPLKNILHPSGTQVYPIMSERDVKDFSITYSNITFIEQNIITEISYDDQGRIIVTIYGPIDFDISKIQLVFYRNGKVVFVAGIKESLLEEKSDVKVGVFSILSQSMTSIAGTRIEYNKTVVVVDGDITSIIPNVMYMKLTDSINSNRNVMYLQKISPSYPLVTGRRSEKISDILEVGEKIDYYGHEYRVDTIDDEAGYIEVTRTDVVDAKADAFISNGKVTKINITEKGKDYLYPPKIIIGNPDCKVAKAEASVNGSGKLSSLTITDGGSGYSLAPKVIIDQPEVIPARATSEINDSSEVARIVLDTIEDESGSLIIENYGYSSAPTVTINSPDALKNFRQATARAVISNGKVTRIEMVDPGRGYTKPPIVTISEPDQVPATASSAISNTKVSKLTIGSNSYSYYTKPPIVTIDPPVMDVATAEAEISTDVDSADYGSVTSVTLTNKGNMYLDEPPSVQFIRTEDGIIKLFDIASSIKNISTDSRYPHIIFFDFLEDPDDYTLRFNEGVWSVVGAYSIDEFINEEGMYDEILFNGNTYTIDYIEEVKKELYEEDGTPHNVTVGYRFHINEFIQDLNQSNISLRRIRNEGYISLLNSLIGTEVRVEYAN